MQSPTHTNCSLVFPSQETGTSTLSSSHVKFQLFFPSLARVAVSLVNLQEVFQLIASGVNTDVSTWLHTRRSRTACWTSHKANKFPCATLCVACENRVMKLCTPIFPCHNIVCKPQQNAHMCTTLGLFKMVRSQPTQGKKPNRDKKADIIVAGAHSVSNLR